MIALRVTLNGRLICTAGAEDLAVLNTIVTAAGNLGVLTKRQRDEPPDLYLSIGGLTGRIESSDEHLRWTEQQPLSVGDRIEVEILDTENVDAPTQARPMDAERQKQKEREHYEYAREVYLRLRHKYEPEQA
jgi:hypothetical protein